jgi:bifunctional non-homologous end joining protein LigD
VNLTNLDRVLYPQTGFTKGDLVDYYRRVAPTILPHLAGRHLTLWRFPSGVHERGFWQNECRGAPEWMRTAEIRGQRFCVVEDERSLLWLANLGTIELHPFLALADAPELPLALVLDLDPGAGMDILDCARLALDVRERLGLRAYVKTSGSLGVHVVAPLAEPTTFDETKARARGLAEELARERPDEVVAVADRHARRGRILVDWLQNDATRSTVAPYSLRGTPIPLVSTPVTWDELAAAREPRDLMFTPDEVLARIDRAGDLALIAE